MKRALLLRAVSVAALAASLGACDYVKPITANPNAVPTASVDQLFTFIQVNSFFFTENQLSRMPAIWIQQMAGTDRQFSRIDTYGPQESDADGEFSAVYTGGGLIDLRKAQAIANEKGWKLYDGILKVYEAYMIGMSAMLWGDLPYSTALDPDKPATLDKQEAVYAAVQKLLDDAIGEMTTGGGTVGGADMVYGGSAAKWIAAAHTLKARYYMHWAKAQKLGASAAAQTACGGDCIQKALAETANGIKNPANDWLTAHTTAQTETNVWFQFMNDRSGYISAGAYLVNLLHTRNDPRLTIYFSPNAEGELLGSAPGENLSTASGLSTTADGYGLPDHGSTVVSCTENQLIAAEANYYLGNTGAAQTALSAGVACENGKYGITVPVVNPSTLSGHDLLVEIMTQKYIAGFLNQNAWADYLRTCIPAVQTYQGRNMPRRMLYGQQERVSNPNIPEPANQPARNTYDPAGCTS